MPATSSVTPEPQAHQAQAAFGGRKAALASGVAVGLIAAPVIAMAMMVSGTEYLPVGVAMVMAVLSSCVLALAAHFTVSIMLGTDHRWLALVPAAVGALVLWWTIVIASQMLSSVYTDVGDGRCIETPPPGSACL